MILSLSGNKVLFPLDKPFLKVTVIKYIAVLYYLQSHLLLLIAATQDIVHQFHMPNSSMGNCSSQIVRQCDCQTFTHTAEMEPVCSAVLLSQVAWCYVLSRDQRVNCTANAAIVVRAPVHMCQCEEMI